MDRKAFFAALRRRESGVFGTSLSQPQVDGINAYLDSCERNNVRDPWGAALIGANIYHETGGYMLPIKETVQRRHKDKNPSDAEVIRRLDAAWAKGQLSWVKTPYWRDGAFGRGPIQTTHWRNYIKMGKRLGLPLREKPELLLDPKHGADSAVIGMAEGLYTGKKISDYSLPVDLDNGWKTHPRRIVNGRDGTDGDIAGYTRAFHKALVAAGWGDGNAAPTEPTERDAILKVGSEGPYVRELQMNLKALGYEISVDGDFGTGTETAVKAFQTSVGLKPDGWAGPRTIDAVGRAVAEMKAKPKIEKAADDAKGKAAQEVEKKTGLWQWLTGLVGSGSLGLGWLGGMDWQTVAALGGVVVVFLIVILVMRRQIIGAVKDIRNAVDGTV